MPRRKKIRLITDENEIREITGRWRLHPRPRCGNCKGPTYVATIDRGARANPRKIEIGRWCVECGFFFRKRRVVRMEY